jgi:hypothetical protein
MARQCAWHSTRYDLGLCADFHFSGAEYLKHALQQPGMSKAERHASQVSLESHLRWGKLLLRICQLELPL